MDLVSLVYSATQKLKIQEPQVVESLWYANLGPLDYQNLARVVKDRGLLSVGLLAKVARNNSKSS